MLTWAIKVEAWLKQNSLYNVKVFIVIPNGGGKKPVVTDNCSNVRIMTHKIRQSFLEGIHSVAVIVQR